MSDRGDYRSFYCAFWDDPDVHALSDRAYRVLTTLKGVLPAAGIGVVYELALCERCRCTRKQLAEVWRELEQPKPGASVGWLVRERNVVWIVNGLRFSPNLSAKDVKHRAFVRKLLTPLGTDRPIVQSFRAHYSDWFGTSPTPSEPEGQPRPIEGPSETLPRGTEGVSEHIDIVIPVDIDSSHPKSSNSHHHRATEFSDDAAREALGDELHAQFLEFVPRQRSWYWQSMTDAIRGVPGFTLTAERLRAIVAEYVANEERPNLGRFRGYLQRAAATPLTSSGPRSTGRTTPTIGERARANAERALASRSSA